MVYVNNVTKESGAEMSYNSPRILLWDIETTHNIVAQFDLRDEYTNPDNIIQERYIVCAAWRWLGEKKVHTISVLDNPKLYAKDPHNDLHVVTTLHKVLSEADVHVGHNSVAFDKKYVDTRILFHNLQALPPIPAIDTYQVAKTRFRFNANRLNYLGKFLGLGGKKPTPPGLWMDVLKGDKKAIHMMVEYNKRDVTLLEDVFLKLRPYVQNHLNRQLFGLSGCPRCGSKHTQSRGLHRAVTRVYRRFQCQKCGGWFKELKPSATPTPARIL